MMSINEYLLRDYAANPEVSLVNPHQMSLDINRVGQHAYTEKDVFSGWFIDGIPLGPVKPEVENTNVSIDKACIMLAALLKAGAKSRVHEKLFQYLVVNLHQAGLEGHGLCNFIALIKDKSNIIIFPKERKFEVFSTPGDSNKITCIATSRIGSCFDAREHISPENSHCIFHGDFISLKFIYNITYSPHKDSYLISLDVDCQASDKAVDKVRELVKLIKQSLSEPITKDKIKTVKGKDAAKILSFHQNAEIIYTSERKPQLQLKSGINVLINKKISECFPGWTKERFETTVAGFCSSRGLKTQAIFPYIFPAHEAHQKLITHDVTLWSFTISVDAQYLATLHTDNRILVWSMETRACVREFKGIEYSRRLTYDSVPMGCSFQVDTNHLVVYNGKGIVTFYDIKNGKEKYRYGGYSSEDVRCQIGRSGGFFYYEYSRNLERSWFSPSLQKMIQIKHKFWASLNLKEVLEGKLIEKAAHDWSSHFKSESGRQVLVETKSEPGIKRIGYFDDTRKQYIFEDKVKISIDVHASYSMVEKYLILLCSDNVLHILDLEQIWTNSHNPIIIEPTPISITHPVRMFPMVVEPFTVTPLFGLSPDKKTYARLTSLYGAIHIQYENVMDGSQKISTFAPHIQYANVMDGSQTTGISSFPIQHADYMLTFLSDNRHLLIRKGTRQVELEIWSNREFDPASGALFTRELVDFLEAPQRKKHIIEIGKVPIVCSSVELCIYSHNRLILFGEEGLFVLEDKGDFNFQPDKLNRSDSWNTRAFSKPKVKYAVVSTDGESLILVKKCELIVFDIQSRRTLKSFFLQSHGITCCAFSPDRNQVVVGNIDGTLRAWDINTGELSRTLIFSDCWYAQCCEYSPDGRFIASWHKDGTVQMWEVRTGQRVMFQKSPDHGKVLMFIDDGKKLRAESLKGKVYRWDISSLMYSPHLNPLVEMHNWDV